jgi:hypothetical protein
MNNIQVPTAKPLTPTSLTEAFIPLASPKIVKLRVGAHAPDPKEGWRLHHGEWVRSFPNPRPSIHDLWMAWSHGIIMLTYRSAYGAAMAAKKSEFKK